MTPGGKFGIAFYESYFSTVGSIKETNKLIKWGEKGEGEKGK